MTKSTFPIPTALSLTALALASSAASAALVDFNTPGDLTRFQVNPASMTEVTSGGLNNSGAIDIITTADSTAIFKEQSFAFSSATPQDVYTVSSYLKLGNFVGTNPSFAALQLGFVTDLGSRFNGGDALNNFVSARLRGDNTAPNNYSLQFQTAAAGTTAAPTQTPSFALTPGNFYFFTVSFNRTATADTFSGTVSLFNSDAAGVVGTQVATQTNSALTAAAVYNDSTAFSGFRANAEPGTDLVDNFSVVPEPSAACLLGLTALGAFGMRRRR